MELLIISLFFTVFGIWLVDYVDTIISTIIYRWRNKQDKIRRKKLHDERLRVKKLPS